MCALHDCAVFEFAFLGDSEFEHEGRWGFLYAPDGIFGWQNLDISVIGLDDHYWFFIDQFGNELYFNVASVPEPETYAMLLVGIGVMMRASRYRRITRAG